MLVSPDEMQRARQKKIKLLDEGVYSPNPPSPKYKSGNKPVPQQHQPFTNTDKKPSNPVVTGIKSTTKEKRLYAGVEYVLDPEGAETDSINMETVTIGNNVPLLAEVIPEEILDRVKIFYCCQTCGKVFWEGAHFRRVCDQFSHILKVQDERDDVANQKAEVICAETPTDRYANELSSPQPSTSAQHQYGYLSTGRVTVDQTQNSYKVTANQSGAPPEAVRQSEAHYAAYEDNYYDFDDYDYDDHY